MTTPKPDFSPEQQKYIDEVLVPGRLERQATTLKADFDKERQGFETQLGDLKTFSASHAELERLKKEGLIMDPTKQQQQNQQTPPGNQQQGGPDNEVLKTLKAIQDQQKLFSDKLSEMEGERKQASIMERRALALKAEGIPVTWLNHVTGDKDDDIKASARSIAKLTLEDPAAAKKAALKAAKFGDDQLDSLLEYVSGETPKEIEASVARLQKTLGDAGRGSVGSPTNPPGVPGPKQGVDQRLEGAVKDGNRVAMIHFAKEKSAQGKNLQR